MRHPTPSPDFPHRASRFSRLQSRRWIVTGLSLACLLALLYYARDFRDGSLMASPGTSLVSQPTGATSAPGSEALAESTNAPASDERLRAIIIETDIYGPGLSNLVPLVLHFATVLGPDWVVTVYTLESTYSEPGSMPFRRLIRKGRIEVRFLPPDTNFANSSRAFSVFMGSPWLWSQPGIEFARSVLIFQSDSILCSKSERRVEDFVQWDYLGAPSWPAAGESFNGGLSLRNPQVMLNITRELSFDNSDDVFEDQYFYKTIKARKEKGEPMMMPSYDLAKTFAVESIYYDEPLGYHQPHWYHRDNPERLAQFETWCPELKLIAQKRVW